jgi:RNA polymerase sigma factor (sigma-70 family)
MSRRPRYLPSYRTNREYESNLSEFRIQAGLTVRELCEMSGVKQPTYSALNSGTLAPIVLTKTSPDGTIGEAKSAVRKLALALGADLIDLFPRYFCSINEHKDISEDEIVDNWHAGLVANDPVDNLLLQEVADVGNEIFNKLPPAHRKVLFARIGKDMTLDEVGKMLGVSKERARQIEKKAIVILKWHAARSPRLKELRGGRT